MTAIAARHFGIIRAMKAKDFMMCGALALLAGCAQVESGTRLP